MSRIRLSRNFYLDEFTRSQTAARRGIVIEVSPDSAIYTRLAALCRHILQPLRDALGPVHITSGYRPAAVNALLGGSETSAHVDGRAADFVVTGVSPLDVCLWIEQHTKAYDQVIHEFGRWTHVALAAAPGQTRREALTALRAGGRTHYVRGLHPLARAQALLEAA